MSPICNDDASPLVHVLGAAVVGRQRRDLVAVEAVEQMPQVEGPVADVEVGVRKVVVDEGLSPAQGLDRVRGLGGDLHQPARAGVGRLVLEPRLLVDDRRDHRRVQVEALGLLTDDVVVTQRQGDLADCPVEVEPTEDHRAPAATTPTITRARIRRVRTSRLVRGARAASSSPAGASEPARAAAGRPARAHRPSAPPAHPRARTRRVELLDARVVEDRMVGARGLLGIGELAGLARLQLASAARAGALGAQLVGR